MPRQAALYIVMHVKSPSAQCIGFQSGQISVFQLEFHVDADYAHKNNDMTAVSGGFVMCTVAWNALVPGYRFTIWDRNKFRFRFLRWSMWRWLA